MLIADNASFLNVLTLALFIVDITADPAATIKIARITITANNSTNVKPLLLFFIFFIFLYLSFYFINYILLSFLHNFNTVSNDLHYFITFMISSIVFALVIIPFILAVIRGM